MIICATILADSLKPIVPCSLLSFSMVPFASCSLAIGGLSWIVPKTVYMTLDNFLYRSYMRLCLFVFENLSGVEIYLKGDNVADVINNNRKPENCVLIANHQSNVDWIIPVMLGVRHGYDGSEQAFRVMVKNSIHLVPLFGWYIFQHGYIYVRRFGSFVGEPVLRQLKWLDNSIPPFWLLIFPEGTRYSAKKTKKIEESNQFLRGEGKKEMKNVLCPRSGGLELALSNLRNLDAVYDVTIMYGQTRKRERNGLAPGMFDFCCGSPSDKKLYIKLKRYSQNELPTDKKLLREWTKERFYEKDKLLEEFYANKELAGQETAVPSVPISTTLPSTLFYVSALIAPFMSDTIRKVYLFTIASSPLLIVWLHIRRCV